MRKTFLVMTFIAAMLASSAICAATEADDALFDGGMRLDGTQNPDGGWGWPLLGASAPNTVGPIAMGLGQSYWNTVNDGTANVTMAAALQKAGAFLLTKTTNFSPSDGYLAAFLDGVLGGTTYTAYVKANFYDPLAAGTYNRNGAGILYDTAQYVQLVRDNRASQGIPNLGAWDCGMGLVGAAASGAGTAAWVAGTKAEINELNGDVDYDVIGLAGALYGLAFVREDFDPTAGEHAAASNIHDLANILASYQIAGGGFSWSSNWVIPNDGDEATQETAYAILALSAVDRQAFLNDIRGAADWLVAYQLANGGWIGYPTYLVPQDENNEVTGEALWGIHAFYVSHVWVSATGKDTNFGTWFGAFRTIQKAVDTVNAGGTITVANGTYDGFGVWHPVTIGSVNGACATSVTGPVSVASGEVTLGGFGHGFTFNAPVTIDSGVDASTIHINWNNILGGVSNTGTGTLDAIYNYWGSLNPLGSISGDVDYVPFLPMPVCKIIAIMDEHHLGPDDAIFFAELLLGGADGDEALTVMNLGNAFGISPDEALDLIDQYGLFRVQWALRLSLGDAGRFFDGLGYHDAIGGNGSTNAFTDKDSYNAGEAIKVSLSLYDKGTSQPVTGALLTLTWALDAKPQVIVFFDVIPEVGNGQYAVSVDTTGWVPGTYYGYVSRGDSTSINFTVTVK